MDMQVKTKSGIKMPLVDCSLHTCKFANWFQLVLQNKEQKKPAATNRTTPAPFTHWNEHHTAKINLQNRLQDPNQKTFPEPHPISSQTLYEKRTRQTKYKKGKTSLTDRSTHWPPMNNKKTSHIHIPFHNSVSFSHTSHPFHSLCPHALAHTESLPAHVYSH